MPASAGNARFYLDSGQASSVPSAHMRFIPFPNKRCQAVKAETGLHTPLAQTHTVVQPQSPEICQRDRRQKKHGFVTIWNRDRGTCFP